MSTGCSVKNAILRMVTKTDELVLHDIIDMIDRHYDIKICHYFIQVQLNLHCIYIYGFDVSYGSCSIRNRTSNTEIIGGFAKRAHPARARYLNVNLTRRKRDLQPGGKEIEGGGRGGGGGGDEEEKSDSW